jgi:hypothetical protein
MRALASRRASGVEALGDDFNWSPGFWLRDGGIARECRLRVRADCGVRPHSRGVGNGIGSDTVSLETVKCN